jgi:hypothetical protein
VKAVAKLLLLTVLLLIDTARCTGWLAVKRARTHARTWKPVWFELYVQRK